MKNCTVWREGKNDDDESMFVLCPLMSAVTEFPYTEWTSLLLYEEEHVAVGLCEKITLSFLFISPSLACMREPFMLHLVETLARYVGIGWSWLKLC